MKFTITSRKVSVTEEMKERIHKKIGKLDKFFQNEADTKIVVWAEREKQYIEVTINAGGILYRAVENDSDLIVAIDNIIDVIERQIRKHKTRLEKQIKKEALDDRLIISDLDYDKEDDEEFNIVKVKKFSVKPMTAEEAILQMNLLGHNFFVFSNGDNGKMSVVYARKDGNYALIESK